MTQRIFIILLFTVFATRSFAYDEHTVQHVSIEVRVQEDGSVRVTEKSKIAVQKLRTLGIMWKRSLPGSFTEADGEIRKIPLTIESLKFNGKSLPFKMQSSLEQHTILFEKDPTRSMMQDFEVEFVYHTDGHILNSGEYQEFFLEVMGPSWFLPVDSMVVDVYLPKKAKVLSYNGRCGGMYTSAVCKQFLTQKSPQHLRFGTFDAIRSSMSYSVEIMFPEGTFVARDSLWNLRFTLLDHGALIGLIVSSLLAFLFFMRVWNRYGMGPEPQKLAMRKSPPTGIGPGLVAFMEYRDQSHYGSLGAVLELAVKGALKIEYHDGTILLHELDVDLDELSRPEQVFYQVLFHHSSSIAIEPNGYNVAFHRAISAYKGAVEQDVGRGEYYSHPWRPWFPGLVLCMAGMVVSSLFLVSHDLIPIFIFSGVGAAAFSYAVFNIFFVKANKGSKVSAFAVFLLSLGCAGAFILMTMPIMGVEAALGLILLMGQPGLFYRLMAAPSKKGRQLLDEVEAYKLFLKEGPRSGDLTEETFSKHLPYTAALALTKQWLQHFESTTVKPHEPLRWYKDDKGTFLQDFGRKTGRKFLSVLMRSIIRSSSGGGQSTTYDDIY